MEEVPDPEPGRGEVLVGVSTAALNRRDVWIRTCDRAQPGLVLGSDAAGLTAAGDEVVIVPYLRWGEREDGPGPDGEILGVPHQGTHAELIAVPTANLRSRPARVCWSPAPGAAPRRSSSRSPTRWAPRSWSPRRRSGRSTGRSSWEPRRAWSTPTPSGPSRW